ncbi:MAG TPA: hypothetical protein VHO06_08830 [Polyangia bacterium]|nr:hypothetical protein [Polyangia bacterium]
MTVNPLGVCTSVTPDCLATVADSQSCAAAMNADACDPGSENADLKSPSCLVMLACVSDLCTDTMCFCPDADSLQTCLSTCKTFTAGLTTDCAGCIAGLYGALSCPDFTALQPPYDRCAATCGHSDGGAGKG